MDDAELRAIRSEVCHLAADWLAAAGNDLWVSSWAIKNPDLEAVALLTQMVGQLGQEAIDAFERERWYAATALTRQIVEANYLMAMFRIDPPQRRRWLNASNNRIVKSFRPNKMRQIAGFDAREYSQHCSWGGHPNPSARWLLPNHNTGAAHPGALAADLAMHLTEGVDMLVSVLETIPGVEPVVKRMPEQGKLPDRYNRWRAVDSLSDRMTFPDTPGVDPVRQPLSDCEE
ncbi:hypothetical protein [Mycobacteroides chelonae]|uniref:hypothetical protein n=1 Tax=Mycobacteroides chelonae TaxID=1774 RepID=UPI0035625C94